LIHPNQRLSASARGISFDAGMAHDIAHDHEGHEQKTARARAWERTAATAA